MKIFIGGWAAGTLFMMFAGSKTDISGKDWFICCVLIGLLFGVAAWGLLP